MKKITGMLLGIGLVISGAQSLFAAQESIRIGFNIPLSGEFKTVGNSAKNIGEMIKEQIMSAGGLQIGDKTYAVEFVYANNTSTASGASKQVLSLASQDKVLGIIGPLSSRQAIPAGEVANAFGVPFCFSERLFNWCAGTGINYICWQRIWSDESRSFV
jgi:branched-chain amino acid transport system substrate-binding protein